MSHFFLSLYAAIALKVKNNLWPPDETPLPYKKILSVTVLLLAEAINSSALFSYIPFIVIDFVPTATKANAGNYAGFIASSFFVGQLLSSYIWGTVSDRIGKRKVLLLGSMGSFVAAVFMAFGRSFWWFLIARFCTGLLNGNIGVAKAYIAQLTDSTNQSRGFSYIGLSWGFGVFVGSFIGGLLARPAKQYPSVFAEDSFFGVFPYFAPTIVGAFVILGGVVLAYFYVEDSDGVQPKQPEETVPLKASLSSSSSSSSSSSTPSKLREQKVKGFGELPTPTFLSKILSNLPCTTGLSSDYSPWKDRVAIWACLTYALCGFYYILHSEVWALWAVLPKESGGLNFTAANLGVSNAITGSSFPFTAFIIVPWATKKWGYINTACVCGGFWATQNLLNPWTSVVSGNTVVTWIVVVIHRVIRGIMGQLHFACVIALLNNSVDREYLGSVNGVGQTFVAISRAIGPFVISPLFAWSATHDFPWPFNQHFAFVLSAVVGVIGVVETYYLPRRLNKPKDEEDFHIMNPNTTDSDDHNGTLTTSLRHRRVEGSGVTMQSLLDGSDSSLSEDGEGKVDAFTLAVDVPLDSSSLSV